VGRLQRRMSEVPRRFDKSSPLTVPENAGLMGDACCSDGSHAPELDPGLNFHLVHTGGDAQLGDLPIPGGVKLVLGMAKDQPCALSQQGSPSGGGLLKLGHRRGSLAGGQPPMQNG